MQWILLEFLTQNSSDGFGNVVAIDQNMVVVGAFRDDEKATDAGAVNIYTNQDDQWIGEKIIADDGQNDDEFGYSVDIDQNTIVIR